MSGLNWVSYSSNNSLNAGYYNIDGLYNNSITFFNSPPTELASGKLSELQLDSGSFGSDIPSYSTFSLGATTNVAIKFSGFFSPNQTGNWTIHLGPGETKPCDDFAILFLGSAGSTITPDTTFTSESNVLSNTLPLIRNIFSTLTGNSKTVYLNSGSLYPILIYYNQGGGGYNFGLGFSLNGGSLITNFSSLTTTIYTPPVTCFKENTKILTDKGYVYIQDLRKGDMIKTCLNDYQAIDMIGKSEIYHHALDNRIKDQLYKCTPENFPEIFEDLIITGCHCILVDNFKDDDQREKTIEINGKIYVTDRKYRLPACVDERTSIYEKEGSYTIYHFALENENYYSNYGIYANGLLVETCSKRYLKEIANMTLI